MTTKPDKVEPHPSWSEQEKWVWSKLLDGEYADFNADPRFGGPLDPTKDELWTEDNENAKNRVLTPKFLQTILLDEPYRSAITRQGVDIRGGWFREPIEMENASIECRLGLFGCRVDGNVNFFMLKSSESIALNGSTFRGILYMNGLHMKGHLFMQDYADFNEVNMARATIDGDVDMQKSRFSGKLNMNGLNVGGELVMRGGNDFSEVVLVGAKVDGQVDMSNSKFNGKLNMNGLIVGGALFMREKAEFSEAELANVKVDGQVVMSESTFNKKLDMDSMHVKGHLFMKNVAIKEECVLAFAVIGGSLLLSNRPGTKLTSINMTGTHIKKDFQLLRGDGSWLDDAKLTLKNCSVGALQDGKDAWPKKVDMDGFTYNRLGGFTADIWEVDRLEKRGTKWMTDWLAKHKPYSPQPYEQLAKVLKESGHKDTANEILFESKKRELAGLSWRTDDNQRINTRKAILTVIQCTIGHGYRYRYLLGWITFFWVFGLFIIAFTTKTLPPCEDMKISNSVYDAFAYSLDMLLPIIELNYWHYTKVCMNGIAKMYFHLQQIVGWFLASVLIAGLSGITKK